VVAECAVMAYEETKEVIKNGRSRLEQEQSEITYVRQGDSGPDT